MNKSSLIVLGSLTAIVVVAAGIAVSVRSSGFRPDSTGVGLLAPDLAGKLNQVTTLVLSVSGRAVTITRPDSQSPDWTVTEKAGYPAAAAQVRRTILALAEAQTLEAKTAKPDLYSKLGVDDTGATRLILRTADGKEVAAVLIGKPAPGGSGLYARRVGEAQSWLVDGKLTPPPPELVQWLNRELPFVTRERVRSVTVVRPGVPPLTVSRKEPGQKDFTVTGLPKDARPKAAAVNEQASAVEMLSFEDVIKLAPVAKPDPAAVVTTVRTFDGEVLTVRISQREGKPWATFTASFEPDKKPPAKAPAPAPEKAADAERMVKEVQTRYAGWSYRLPEYLAKDLMRRAEDLIDAEANQTGLTSPLAPTLAMPPVTP